MHIAGGLYRELCYVPAWDAMYGSGGRAAAAVSLLSPGSTLHTYTEDLESPGVRLLENLGIELEVHPRSTTIAFAYFHPLSRPHIQPPPDQIKQQPAIKVWGDAVLRFGFIEGEAVIEARRAVFDPQTWRNSPAFRANGSVAEELAIVLNELELRSTTGLDDLALAADYLLQSQNAGVVVAKGGTRGAMVFERNGQATHVPAYRSSRVFKIGTGDVFTAIFAHHWAEKRLSPVMAADFASKSVAAYCSSSQLPVATDKFSDLVPVKFLAPGKVILEGTVDTIGQRYTMEEARFVLRELGVEVTCQALDGVSSESGSAMLVLADGLDDQVTESVIRAKARGMPIVVLRERSTQHGAHFLNEAGVTGTDDFASALYFAAWAASESA